MAIIEAVSGEGIIGHAETYDLGYQTSISQVSSQSGRRTAQRRGPLLYNVKVNVGAVELNGEIYHQIMDNIHDLEYGTNTLSFNLDNQISTGYAVTSPRGVWDTTQPTGFQYNNEDDTGKLTPGTPPIADQIHLGAKVAGQRGQTVVLKGAYGGDYVSSLYPFTEVVPPNTADGRDQTGSTTFFIGRKGDYIQFDGSTKVYQLTADCTSTKNGPVSENCIDSGGVVVNAYSGDVTVKINSPLVNSPDVDVQFADVVRGVRIGTEVKFNMALSGIPRITYHPGNIVEFGEFTFQEVINDA